MDKKRSESIYTVPMQIKKNVSIGNIYDFLIADFFSIIKEQQGINVKKPIIFNINGQKTVELLKKENIEPTNTQEVDGFIKYCKNNILKTLLDFGITFSYEIDDNKITKELEDLMASRNYKDIFLQGPLTINKCPKCNKEFGTDFSIQKCKYCNSKTIVYTSQNEFYQKVDHNTLFEKIEQINRGPISTKSKLMTYIKSLPKEYLLQLSKQKGFTLEINNKALDPRFIAIVSLLLDSIKSSAGGNKTIIHGDVIKKYDYYMLLHTKKEDLPETIIAHGNIMDENGQKSRWDPLQQENESITKYSTKALRCVLLKNDIFKGVKLDAQNLTEQLRQVSKYYVKITQILNNREVTFSTNENTILLKTRQEFIGASNSYKLGMSYNYFIKIVDILRNITKNKTTISPFEYECLQTLLLLYYGEKWQ